MATSIPLYTVADKKSFGGGGRSTTRRGIKFGSGGVAVAAGKKREGRHELSWEGVLELLRLRKVMNKRLLKKVVDVVHFATAAIVVGWENQRIFRFYLHGAAAAAMQAKFFLSLPPFSPRSHCSGNREKQIWGSGGGGRNSRTFRSFSRRTSPLSRWADKAVEKKKVLNRRRPKVGLQFANSRKKAKVAKFAIYFLLPFLTALLRAAFFPRT